MNITTDQLVNQVVYNAQVSAYNNELIANLTKNVSSLVEQNVILVSKLTYLANNIALFLGLLIISFIIVSYLFIKQNEKIKKLEKPIVVKEDHE